MHKFSSASLVLALAAPLSAPSQSQAQPQSQPPGASTPPDMATIRQEIEAIRGAYEARLQALEQRLKAAELAARPATAAAGAGTAPAALAQAPAPPGAAAGTATSAPLATALTAPVPPVASAAAGASAFNPAMSLILSGLYGRTTQDPARYAITGFQLPKGAEAGPGTRGFSLAETELGFAASIDPWLRGVANIALHPDNVVSVEEAYLLTTSLGQGLQFKAGRFFSGVGYVNAQHAHTWDFVDNPLAYQAMLGTQYGDDGVQLNWLAPTDQYIELGAELGRGRSYPGGDNAQNGAGMAALMVHTGGDIGDSQTWRAGVSLLTAKASDQSLLGLNAAGSAVTNVFSGNTRVAILDGVWKWAPGGNATRTSVKLQGEYLRSTRSGNLVDDLDGSNSPGRYRAVQSGWYMQGVYQFMPRWRVGLRTERLDAGSPAFGGNTGPNAGLMAGLLAGLVTADNYRPSKNSLMLDFNPSEFSRIRLQFARDQSRLGATDNQVFLQYQMSLGAHGAHRY